MEEEEEEEEEEEGGLCLTFGPFVCMGRSVAGGLTARVHNRQGLSPLHPCPNQAVENQECRRTKKDPPEK